jgi:hypothetical protein
MEKFVRKGYENANFFIGPEIEHTTAYGKKTLFVRNLQSTELVEKLAREHHTPHIFIGVSRSFDSLELKDGVYMVGDTLAADWEKQIHYLLDQGFMVTLDYPAHKHYDVLKVLNPGIWQSRNFIPMLAVPVPCIETSSHNLTIKIDDSNFAETNPGVWCLNFSEVTDSNRFTGWQEYGDDMILDVPKVQFSTPDASKAKVYIEEKVEVKVSETAELNLQDLGLDPEAPSMLKPDPEAVEAASKAGLDKVDALAAYTDGATEDPLSKPVKLPKKSKSV